MENSGDVLGANVGGARRIARDLIKKSGIEEIPISLVKIINYLQTQHELKILSFPFTESISGILVKDGEFITIGFNENHPWCRRRFTIAHEIGHFLMGHLCNGGSSSSEAEAHKFAAELLMPAIFFKKEKRSDLNMLSKKYLVSKEAVCLRLMDCRMV